MSASRDYLASLDAWKAQRLANLKADSGWLNIIGRYWLGPGSVTVGAAADNDIVLTTGPARVGTLTQDEAGQVSFTPANGGDALRLALDKKNPPKFQIGRLLLEVTTLNGENALRVRDTQSKAPGAFPGIDSFGVKPEWRIVADWVPYDQPRGVTVNTTKDIATDVEVSHKAVFTLDGTRYELLATHGTPEAPQFVIRDLTSRDTTYPASRFLYGEDVTADTIVLDFNKAINPPCAFTDHAVCPLPPPENILPIRIEAGEKRLAR
ncbi:DUF1684 domain-containing protein [Kaistia algarum]|uniref:DUF1684 domain-containing protein n=1 Tax=Kaistia algarum TaxID=2083279 RepID=UPI000CE78339|nr:DUF1684 domain-containing protein [Kaistia algarum]MCX5514001.1 DUF1684 domain-containing protein [Kaistia algarum]PPE78034.1 DUF1684 domain-containing protein [Kaistia algarum]